MKTIITALFISITICGFSSIKVEDTVKTIIKPSPKPIEIKQKGNTIHLSKSAVHWSIIASSGKEMLSGNNSAQISIEGLPLGTYIIKVEDLDTHALATQTVYKK